MVIGERNARTGVPTVVHRIATKRMDSAAHAVKECGATSATRLVMKIVNTAIATSTVENATIVNMAFGEHIVKTDAQYHVPSVTDKPVFVIHVRLDIRETTALNVATANACVMKLRVNVSIVQINAGAKNVRNHARELVRVDAIERRDIVLGVR